ncbi:hypothetical protein DB30_05278 [Enhygromyxa salina]|uniref:Uncharacterized protein n=1 Tax=Enhygromyxa salina TaxID=215803 RepID=A0A0C1ZXC4_9BACT|nr:hypothetical protein [Enhygromyxa salina]KIG15708.1 hypothetical protein DB30_05278 [Enhygromyxa salina]
MGVTEELYRLGQAARRLNDGSDQLDRTLSEIDGALARLMLGFEYQLPRPIAEHVHHDNAGKRVIEVSYLGYLRMDAGGDPGESISSGVAKFHLGVKTLKILEGRSSSGEQPGRVVTLLEAPRAIRHAAVDHLARLVAGLAEQVDEMVGNIERRNAIAVSILDTLGSSRE